MQNNIDLENNNSILEIHKPSPMNAEVINTNPVGIINDNKNDNLYLDCINCLGYLSLGFAFGTFITIIVIISKQND